jgi:NAD(P)-dependent dehydrogenase (short-subunit alcohol dehydrogenase family)
MAEQPVVLVTGGASGIGAALARKARERGSEVIIADLDAERGERLAAEIGAAFVRTDVRQPADNTAVVAAALGLHGRLDRVHLNAGVLAGTSIGPGFDVDAYRLLVGVNLDAVVFGVQAALPALRESGGSILVTASATGMRPSPEVLYAATKHAVIGLVRSLGPVLVADGVAINAICPGLVDTPMIAARRESISDAGLPVADTAYVVDAAERVLADGRTGQAWVVMADRSVTPFEFAELPITVS